MKLDVVAIAAGLLHDIVEDTQTPIERIRELFGADVAHVVEGVTKLGAIPFSSSEERQAENFRKMLLAMVDDIRVILVKLADRLHNMRTLHHLPRGAAHQDRAGDARHLRARSPTASGMSKIKNELEELAFKYLEPKRLRGAAVARREPAPRHRGHDRGAEEERSTAKLAEAQVPVIADRRPHQASVQHPPEAEAAEDRPRSGLRPRRAAHRHAVGQGLLRGARHHPPDVVAGAGPDQGLHRDAAAERLPVAAHVGHQRARLPVRGADPHRRDAPDRRRRHRRALEVQGRARRRRARRAVLPAGCASCSSGSRRCAIRRSSCRT